MTIIDMHQDLRMHIERLYPYPHPNHVQSSFEMLEKTNVKLVFASGFPYPLDERHFDPGVNELITDDLKFYNAYCDKHRPWSIVTTRKELETVFKKEGKYGLLLHIEGVNAFAGTNE